jgi:hypothetical protein
MRGNARKCLVFVRDMWLDKYMTAAQQLTEAISERNAARLHHDSIR